MQKTNVRNGLRLITKFLDEPVETPPDNCCYSLRQRFLAFLENASIAYILLGTSSNAVCQCCCLS